MQVLMSDTYSRQALNFETSMLHSWRTMIWVGESWQCQWVWWHGQRLQMMVTLATNDNDTCEVRDCNCDSGGWKRGYCLLMLLMMMLVACMDEDDGKGSWRLKSRARVLIFFLIIPLFKFFSVPFVYFFCFFFLFLGFLVSDLEDEGKYDEDNEDWDWWIFGCPYQL